MFSITRLGKDILLNCSDIFLQAGLMLRMGRQRITYAGGFPLEKKSLLGDQSTVWANRGVQPSSLAWNWPWEGQTILRKVPEMRASP